MFSSSSSTISNYLYHRSLAATLKKGEAGVFEDKLNPSRLFTQGYEHLKPMLPVNLLSLSLLCLQTVVPLSAPLVPPRSCIHLYNVLNQRSQSDRYHTHTQGPKVRVEGLENQAGSGTSDGSRPGQTLLRVGEHGNRAG